MPATLTFIDDNDGYLAWLETHTKGFVVNAYRKPTSSYLMLHRATCGHIRSSERTNWTTSDYLKVCSPDVCALEQWATDVTGGALDLCGVCLPTASPVAVSGKLTDALRGYAFEVHKRDGFTCRYCGLDGKESFDNWIRLSQDHLLPTGHKDRDNPDFIVTACMFCNTADNRYFDQTERRQLQFDDMTPEQLVEQRRPYVIRTRSAYCKFWTENAMT